MKIQTLEYFIAMAESKSINEAAQKLYIAQPSLTKALQSFERELGVSLFHRAKSGITLTDAGKRILPEARQIVAYYNEWLSLGKERTLSAVDIYIHTSFPNFLLPDLVFRFKQLHPDLNITCTETAIPERYISRDTKKPVLVLFPCSPGSLYQKSVADQGNRPLILFQGKYVCLVNRRNPLAQKKAVTVEDLSDSYLVLPDMDTPLGGNSPLSPLIETIKAASPKQIFYVDSVNSVIDLVNRHTNTYALSYYPALNRYSAVANKELVYVPFSGFNTQSNFCLFYSKQAYAQYPVLQQLIKAIQEAAAQFLSEHDTI